MIKIQYNNKTIHQLSTSHYLYINSSLFKTIEELNEEEIIPLPCKPFLHLIENDINELFILSNDMFIDVYTSLSFIGYENNDESFIRTFIEYVMSNNINLNEIGCMKHVIRSINNYNRKMDMNIQIRECNIIFYSLYLKEHVEIVIKHGRHDLLQATWPAQTPSVQYHNKYDYFKYVHKYNNQLTHAIKLTPEYITYVNNLNKQFFNNVSYNEVKQLVDNGINIDIPLIYTYYNYNINIIKL